MGTELAIPLGEVAFNVRGINYIGNDVMQIMHALSWG